MSSVNPAIVSAAAPIRNKGGRPSVDSKLAAFKTELLGEIRSMLTTAPIVAAAAPKSPPSIVLPESYEKLIQSGALSYEQAIAVFTSLGGVKAEQTAAADTIPPMQVAAKAIPQHRESGLDPFTPKGSTKQVNGLYLAYNHKPATGFAKYDGKTIYYHTAKSMLNHLELVRQFVELCESDHAAAAAAEAAAEASGK